MMEPLYRDRWYGGTPLYRQQTQWNPSIETTHGGMVAPLYRDLWFLQTPL